MSVHQSLGAVAFWVRESLPGYSQAVPPTLSRRQSTASACRHRCAQRFSQLVGDRIIGSVRIFIGSIRSSIRIGGFRANNKVAAVMPSLRRRSAVAQGRQRGVVLRRPDPDCPTRAVGQHRLRTGVSSRMYVAHAPPLRAGSIGEAGLPPTCACLPEPATAETECGHRRRRRPAPAPGVPASFGGQGVVVGVHRAQRCVPVRLPDNRRAARCRPGGGAAVRSITALRGTVRRASAAHERRTSASRFGSAAGASTMAWARPR